MVCCCRSTVASGAISQDDLNSQQNYCFSADSCSPFFLGGGCSILLSYGDILDILPIFHPTVKNYMFFSAEDEKTEFPPLQNRQNRI